MSLWTVCTAHYTHKKGQHMVVLHHIKPLSWLKPVNYMDHSPWQMVSQKIKKFPHFIQNLTISYNLQKVPCPDKEYFSIHCDITLFKSTNYIYIDILAS
jgi:hypothetical protein